jgi:hypothetical protein
LSCFGLTIGKSEKSAFVQPSQKFLGLTNDICG